MADETDDLLKTVARASATLVADAATLSDADVAAPSALPGWTRGHVLTHLARNAEAHLNLLSWAVTGVATPMYPSAEARDAAIEDGSSRSASRLLADLKQACRRFSEASVAVPPEAWNAQITLRSADPAVPAARIIAARLQEVVVHHVDLGIGYTFRDVPTETIVAVLDYTVEGIASRPGLPSFTIASDEGGVWPVGHGGSVEVSGGTAEIVAWLAGRAAGSGLTVVGGDLPALPSWG